MQNARWIGVMVGVLLCCIVSASAEEPIKVTFINPGISDTNNPTGGFWLAVSAFMQAVAKALKMNVEILYAERNHVLMQQQAVEVANRTVRPDYLIVVNEKLAAGKMVEVANAAGIKTFMINNIFMGEQVQQYGAPREKYPYWIGSLIPDNRLAGYQIAKYIITRALQAGVKASDGKLHLVAIAGDRVTQASVERVEGLHQALAEYPDVELKQTFYAEWSKDKAYEQTVSFLQRYPEIGAIWGVNDPIALGALEGAVAAKKRPGHEVFIGGLNWDKPALAKVQDGSLVTTVGGHFMTGGWALVLLYDYHHGRDFAEEGVQLQRPIFDALHHDNIALFVDKLSDPQWSKVDFTHFSKVRHPTLKHYDFSLDAILQQLR
jgi:ABC-type sugar transport system substrate-binding protein